MLPKWGGGVLRDLAHGSDVVLWLQLQVINNIKQDVVKSLSLYYFTFVDIMDFKVRFHLYIFFAFAQIICTSGKVWKLLTFWTHILKKKFLMSYLQIICKSDEKKQYKFLFSLCL